MANSDMRIMLDEQPLAFQAGSIAEAIAGAADQAERNGRMIVSVEVDGQAWTEAHLNDRETVSGTAEEIRLTSAEPRELVSTTFTEASEALGDVESIQSEAASLIQSDDTQEAMQRLSEALTLWQSVRQAITQGSELLGLDLDEIEVDGRPAGDVVGELADRLKTLKGQLEVQDHLGAADTLLYDLPEVTDHWRGLIMQLQERVD